MATSEPIPLDLTEVLRVGAVYQGRRVFTVALAFDGGKMEIELKPGQVIEEEESGIQPRKKIIEALEGSDIPLSRKQLAKKIGLKNAKGRFSTTVSRLLETGEIHEREGLLTNDASKHLDE